MEKRKYENNNAQICFTDNSGSHQRMLNEIRDKWIKENPHNLSDQLLYKLKQSKGISATLRILIELEYSR